ncbi:DNA repair protein RAD52 homolog isoform X3 [Ostrinia furnacalis]|uniref:DNA repair protein RAD52 homolog isoform X3 n=1 Tax=Ostrinia furnacalis TaxID=93504 RepID=UPI00103AB12C|nr:DNA repair protein RAD52 homolog isoform X3 [Ostrinia furnacalis]
MQRKPGFPVANCSIKMPDNMNMPAAETLHNDEDPEQQQKRQQLINFGHTQWGFNNWSWTVTKQDLDFVDFTNGKYCAGVCAYVSVTVKSFDIHRENIGYATSLAVNKGFAIYKSRKCAVTNALRETLLSFGGSVATELAELLESHKAVTPPPAPHPAPDENNQNAPNKMADAAPKNSPLNRGPRKEDCPANNRALQPQIKNAPVATAHPMPAPALAPRPPRPPVPPAPLRPNSNEATAAPPVDAAEEEARAERKRRQRQAQEEFRQRQMAKQKTDEKQDLHKNCSSFDQLLMELPSQDIVIQETGDSVDDAAKRKSALEGSATKRRASVINRLDIVEAD